MLQRPEGLSQSLQQFTKMSSLNGIDTPTAPNTGPAIITPQEYKGGNSINNKPHSHKVRDIPPKHDAFLARSSNSKHDLLEPERSKSVQGDYLSINTNINTLDVGSINDIHLVIPDSLVNHETSSLKNEHFDRVLRLPKVRMFVCGSEAMALSKLIYPELPVPAADNVNKIYHCVRFTMGMDRKGTISVKQCLSYEQILQDMEPNKLHDSTDSLNQSDVSQGSEDGNSLIHRGSINVELYIVTDDKFFHHCCQYLFTRTSIFILTFDGQKVLKSSHGEILRLQNMIHTIRCYDNYECSILTYGLLTNDSSDIQSVTIDEVRTLFYLPFGNQIQNYNVSMPELFCQGLVGTDGQDIDVSRKIKRGLWRVISDMARKQTVLLPSIALMIQLDRYRRNSCSVIAETDFAHIFQAIAPGGGQDLQQMVWTDLKNVGEILSSSKFPCFSSFYTQLLQWSLPYYVLD